MSSSKNKSNIIAGIIILTIGLTAVLLSNKKDNQAPIKYISSTSTEIKKAPSIKKRRFEGKILDVYNNSRFKYKMDFMSEIFTAQGESDSRDGQSFKHNNLEFQVKVYGNRFYWENNLKELFDKEIKNLGGKVAYQVIKKDWYVYSYSNKNQEYYRKTISIDNNEYNINLEFSYSKDESIYEKRKLVEKLVRGFKSTKPRTSHYKYSNNTPKQKSNLSRGISINKKSKPFNSQTEQEKRKIFDQAVKNAGVDLEQLRSDLKRLKEIHDPFGRLTLNEFYSRWRKGYYTQISTPNRSGSSNTYFIDGINYNGIDYSGDIDVDNDGDIYGTFELEDGTEVEVNGSTDGYGSGTVTDENGNDYDIDFD